MDRTKTRLSRLEQQRDGSYLEATPAERLQLVWPLTLEATSFFGGDDAQRRLQRDVTKLGRRGR